MSSLRANIAIAIVVPVFSTVPGKWQIYNEVNNASQSIKRNERAEGQAGTRFYLHASSHCLSCCLEHDVDIERLEGNMQTQGKCVGIYY